MQYDGAAAPAASPIPVTINNQLSAPLPTFTGPVPSPPLTYASSISYFVAPVFAAPASFTITHGTTAQVTGYDPLSTNSMMANVCSTTAPATLGTLASNGSLANGIETFTFTAGSTPGTCTFTINDTDTDTNVPSNTVTVTIQ